MVKGIHEVNHCCHFESFKLTARGAFSELKLHPGRGGLLDPENFPPVLIYFSL